MNKAYRMDSSETFKGSSRAVKSSGRVFSSLIRVQILCRISSVRSVTPPPPPRPISNHEASSDGESFHFKQTSPEFRGSCCLLSRLTSFLSLRPTTPTDSLHHQQKRLRQKLTSHPQKSGGLFCAVRLFNAEMT